MAYSTRAWTRARLFATGYLFSLITQVRSRGLASGELHRVLAYSYRDPTSLCMVRLPSGLQNLTLGDEFDHDRAKVRLPSSLQSLVVGDACDQSRDKVQLPSGPQSQTLGDEFNQVMSKVQLPSSPQSRTFGDEFCQVMGHDLNVDLDCVSLSISVKVTHHVWRFEQY